MGIERTRLKWTYAMITRSVLLIGCGADGLSDYDVNGHFGCWLGCVFPEVGVDGPGKAGDADNQAGQRNWVHVAAVPAVRRELARPVPW
jgi:hypothetical protein